MENKDFSPEIFGRRMEGILFEEREKVLVDEKFVTWEAVFKDYGTESSERSWGKGNLTRNKFYKYLKRWF